MQRLGRFEYVEQIRFSKTSASETSASARVVLQLYQERRLDLSTNDIAQPDLELYNIFFPVSHPHNQIYCK